MDMVALSLLVLTLDKSGIVDLYRHCSDTVLDSMVGSLLKSASAGKTFLLVAEKDVVVVEVADPTPSGSVVQ